MSAVWGPLPAELEPPAAALIEQYFAALHVAVQQFNLTADPPERWIERHLADVLQLPPLRGSLADVGAGAGFLGIVLAILDPTRTVALIDSVRKRARFLEQVAHQLGLDRVVVDARRAELCGRDPAHRDRYDAVVARALAPPLVAAELVLPLVRPGGTAWLLVSEEGGRELAERAPLEWLNARLGEVRTYRLPCDDRPRSRVRLDKLGPTPAGFPRRDGEPARSPLVRP